MSQKSIIPNSSIRSRLVMKDNALIMGSYSLSVEEQRLILASIEKAQRMKEPLNSRAVEVSLSVKEYSELYSLKLKTAYKGLESASDRLYERSIKLNDEGVRREVRWLQEKAIYDSGRVKLVFSATISKHISEIVTKRSTFRLEQATQLRNQHAIRFFEIFHIMIDPETQEGEWEVTVEEIKDLLEIHDLYPRWVDFKRRVIIEAVRQINANTSLRVDWDIAGKEGKRITAVKFTIFESSQLRLSL